MPWGVVISMHASALYSRPKKRGFLSCLSDLKRRQARPDEVQIALMGIQGPCLEGIRVLSVAVVLL
jgi:hypothetical protein